MKRVVVTGMGILSPVGVGVDKSWEKLVNGGSGLVNFPFSCTFTNSQVCGYIPRGTLAEGKLDFSEHERTKGASDFIEYAMIAAKEALVQSKILSEDGTVTLTEDEKCRTGVNIGSGIGGLQQIYDSSISLSKEKEYSSNMEQLSSNYKDTLQALSNEYDDAMAELVQGSSEAIGLSKQYHGDIQALSNQYMQDLQKGGGYKRISPFFIPSSLINLNAGHVSIKYGFKGPNISLVTACATGTHSIGDGFRMIKDGYADIMVTGASEASVCPIGIAGFDRMQALSTKYNHNPKEASRPWDKGRDGFVIAEGAGILVLEEYEHAKKRGVPILAEVVGFGMSGDASHMTAPLEDGAGAARCMEIALKGINKADIGYVNAHGTSTPLGDKAEIAGLKKVFGSYADKLSISSTKSAVGHALGAAGAIEAIFSIQALNTGIIPPTLNLNDPDESCDLDLTPNKAVKKDIRYAISNSFGFGGTNGTVVLKKIND